MKLDAFLMFDEDLDEFEQLIADTPYRYALPLAEFMARVTQRQRDQNAEFERRQAASRMDPVTATAANQPDPQAFLDWVASAMSAPRDQDPLN